MPNKRRADYKGEEYKKLWRHNRYLNTVAKEGADGYRSRQREEYRELRRQVLEAYGALCQECGSTEDLQIDHINQDGPNHKTDSGKQIKGPRLLRFLRRNEFPVGYRTLCGFCNRSAWTLHQLGVDVSKQGFIERTKRALLAFPQLP